MASMDNLRDKIRSRRADTSDLEAAVPTPAPTAAFAHRFDDDDVDDIDDSPAASSEVAFSGSNTDSLISEIFSDEGPSVPVFPTHEKPEPKAKKPKAERKSKPEPEPKQRKSITFALIERFKHLEVNRKMLGVSLAIAGIAATLAVFMLKGIAEPYAKQVSVISLTQDVPAGTPLTEKMVKIQEMPAQYVPEGAEVYEKGMPLIGKIAVSNLAKGEILIKSRTKNPQDVKVYIDPPKGFRPIQVKTDNTGLVQPSTQDRKEYVDLIANIPDPDPGRKGKVIPYLVVQHAMVLMVGDKGAYNQNPEGADTKAPAFSTPNNSNMLTVAVPDDRVNLMVMLEDKTVFKVIPRASNDETTQPDKYTVQEIEDMLQGKIESPAPAASADTSTTSAPAKPAPPATPKVNLESHGPDLSGGGGGGSSYRAPARSYTPPAQTYRAPARSYTPPARSYTPPARPAAPAYHAPAAAPAPASRPARVKMGNSVIQGGAVTGSH